MNCNHKVSPNQRYSKTFVFANCKYQNCANNQQERKAWSAQRNQISKIHEDKVQSTFSQSVEHGLIKDIYTCVLSDM